MANEITMRDVINLDEVLLIIKAAMDLEAALTNDEISQLETIFLKLKCAGVKVREPMDRSNGK